MTWRFWQHRASSAPTATNTALDTSFATVFSPTTRLNSRIQQRVSEERRGLLQLLALLQCVLALLMPMVLHFIGVQALWPMVALIVLALVFAVCAWQLMRVQPLVSTFLVTVNVLVLPIVLFACLAWSSFSPMSVAFPFVLQMMLLLVLPLRSRVLMSALSLSVLLALWCVLTSSGKTLEQVAAIFLLAIAVALLLLVAQRLFHQHVRLGAIGQHVRKDSEKMAVRAEKMRRLALTDGLTGLANRLSLMNKLQRVLTEPERASRAVLYLIDLDFFKTVNDQFGHAAGDAVLIECGQRFKSVVRRGDVVCRLGGDEFVIVVHDLVGIVQAQAVAQKILQKLTDPLWFEGIVMPLGGSIGVAQWHTAINTAEVWLSEADAAMYQAKTAGRNQFYISRVER
ncbi:MULTISPECIES: GGDEF domain-containing protein [Deefgea]|nr:MULTISPECIES: GGDEF domain-containing protein [Deefgea]MBM9887848.1 GGDEF domain-containing protein [Deefgea sp. CFH1-16]